MKLRKLICAALALVMLVSCMSGVTLHADSELVSIDDLDMSRFNLPVMQVNTENGAAITSKNDYVPCDVGVTNTEDKYCLSPTAAGIRLRGNSTYGFPKKPYRIKFNKKQDLFGMGKAKSWVLLANWIDKTMVRSAIAFAVGKELGLEYTSEYQFVNVVLNGEYIGVYMLCEQTQTGATRVNIEESEDGKIDTGYLLELVGNGDKSEDRWFVPGVVSGTEYLNWRSGNPMNVFIKTPEMQYCTDDQVAFIQDYFVRFNTAILLHDWDAFNELCDVDSFVKYFIVGTFTNNGDGGYQLFFYKKQNGGKMYAGPIWDFDQSAAGSTQCGSYKDSCTKWYVGSQNPWFESFSDWEPFLNRASELYRDHIEAFQEIIDYYCYEFYPENKYDLDANEARWGTVASTDLWRITNDIKRLLTYEENYEYLRRYYTDRTLWLDAHYHNLGEYVYDNNATCGRDGTETAVCVDCGYRSVRVAVGTHESVPHTFGEYVSDNNATCGTNCTETSTCAVCGATQTREIPNSTDPDRHVVDSFVFNNDSTCTRNGTETGICTLCGTTVTREAIGTMHSYAGVPVPPTCTERGYTVFTCTVCGDSYVGAYTDPVGHKYRKEVTPPTCNEWGFTEFTCTVCGYSYIGDPTEALVHEFEEFFVPPTPDSRGYLNHVCKNCGDSYADNYTAPLGAGSVVTGMDDSGFATIDYDAALAAAYVINPAWAGISSGGVSFRFRGTTVTETYDPSRHFASYAEALDAYTATDPDPVADAKPVFIFAPGTYTDPVVLPFGGIVLGPNAGIDPNAPTEWDYTVLDGGWDQNPAYDSANAAVFSGGVCRATTMAGTEFDSTAYAATAENMTDPEQIERNKYIFALEKAEKTAGVAACVDIIIDGVTVTGGKAALYDYDIGQQVTDGSELITVSGHRSSGYHLQNSVVRDTGSYYIDAWDVSKNYINTWFNKTRFLSLSRKGGIFGKGIDCACFKDCYIYGDTALTGSENTEYSGASFAKGSTSRRNTKLEYRHNFFYNNGTLYPFTMSVGGSWQADPGVKKMEFVMDGNIVIDVGKGGSWGYFVTFLGADLYSTFTGNVFWAKNHTMNTFFNGNDSYQTKTDDSDWYFTFTGNKIIGNVKSLGGNINWAVSNGWNYSKHFYIDVRENYWAAKDGDPGKKVSISAANHSGYPNGYDAEKASYYFDGAMTTLSTDLDIVSIDAGGTGVSAPAFNNDSAEISFDLKEGDAGGLTVVLADGASGGFYTDAACTEPVELGGIAFDPANQRTYTLYYKVVKNAYSKTFTVTVRAGDVQPVADAFIDGQLPGSEVVFLDPAAAFLAAGSDYVVDWNGGQYIVTVGSSAFSTQEGIVSAGMTYKTVLVKSPGSNVDFTVKFAGVFYGEAWNMTPYVKGTAADGSDWTENSRFFAKAAAVRNILIAPTMTGGSVTIRGFISNGYYRDLYRSDYSDTLDVTLENWVINVLSSYTQPSYTVHGESDGNRYVFRPGNDGVLSKNSDDSLTVKALYMKRVDSGNRLIGEQVNKYTTFDSCWFKDNNAIGLTGIAYVKPCIPDSVFTFKNCNFQNFRPNAKSGSIMAFESTKTDSLGNDVIITGNIFRHSGMQTGSDGTLYLMRWYQVPFDRFDFTDNRVFAGKIDADGSSLSDKTQMFHTADVRSAPIDITITGNVFACGINSLDLEQGGTTAGYINCSVHSNFSASAALTAADAASDTGVPIRFTSAGYTGPMAEANPYYLDMDMTVLASEVKITDVCSVSPDITDVVFDAENRTISFTIAGGDSDGLAVTAPAAELSYYRDAACTVPAGKIVYDEEDGGNATYYLRSSKNGVGLVYTVNVFVYIPTKSFAAEFSDGHLDSTNSVVIDNNVAGMSAGSEYVFSWKNGVYSATVGADVFETAEAAAANGYIGEYYNYLVTSVADGRWTVSTAGSYYTPAWDAVPYIRGTAPDGSDWTDNPVFAARATRVGGSVYVDASLSEKDLGFYGFYVTNGAWHINNLKTDDNAHNTVTVENILFDSSRSGNIFYFDSIANTAASRYSGVNTINLNNAYFKLLNDWRLMSEACPAHVFIDGMYCDARASHHVNNSAYIKQYARDNLFVIRNSNLRNWVRPNGNALFSWEHANKTDAENGESNVIKLENNILYNFVNMISGKKPYLVNHYANGGTGFEITGNTIILNRAEARALMTGVSYSSVPELDDYDIFWNSYNSTQTVTPYIEDGAIKIRDNTIVGWKGNALYCCGSSYTAAALDVSDNFAVPCAEYEAHGGDLSACRGVPLTIAPENTGGFAAGAGGWWFDFERTMHSSDTGYPVEYNGVSTFDLAGGVTGINVGTDERIDLTSYVGGNPYGCQIAYYADELLETPVDDPTAVPAGVYYAQILSPDGSQPSDRVFAIDAGSCAQGHSFTAEFDENGHFDRCVRCGSTANYGPHVYDDEYDVSCNGCAFVRAGAADVINPVKLGNASLLTNDSVDISAGVAQIIDLLSMITNPYGNLLSLSDCDGNEIADLTAVAAGERGSAYLLTVSSPDGSVSKTVAVNLVPDSALSVSADAAGAPLAVGGKVRLSWRGRVRAHGEYTLEADGGCTVGVMFTSVTDGSRTEAAKAALIAAAQSGSGDCIADFNETADGFYAYSAGKDRMLYMDDPYGAWTCRYSIDVTAGDTVAAIMFVIWNDGGAVRVAFSEPETQTAVVG